MRFTFAAAAILATTYAAWQGQEAAPYERIICDPNDPSQCHDLKECDETGCEACVGPEDALVCGWVEGATTYGEDCFDDTGCWYCQPEEDDNGGHHACVAHMCSDGACYGCGGTYYSEEDYDYECALTAVYEGCGEDDDDCWWCDHSGECGGYGTDDGGAYTCNGKTDSLASAVDWDVDYDCYYNEDETENGGEAQDQLVNIIAQTKAVDRYYEEDGMHCSSYGDDEDWSFECTDDETNSVTVWGYGYDDKGSYGGADYGYYQEYKCQNLNATDYSCEYYESSEWIWEAETDDGELILITSFYGCYGTENFIGGDWDTDYECNYFDQEEGISFNMTYSNNCDQYYDCEGYYGVYSCEYSDENDDGFYSCEGEYCEFTAGEINVYPYLVVEQQCQLVGYGASEEYGNYAYTCDRETNTCEGYYFDGDCVGDDDEYACYGLVCTGTSELADGGFAGFDAYLAYLVADGLDGEDTEKMWEQAKQIHRDQKADYSCQTGAYGFDDEQGYWASGWDDEHSHGYGFTCAPDADLCDGYYVDEDWEEDDEGNWAGSGLYCHGTFDYDDEESWENWENADFSCEAYQSSFDAEAGMYTNKHCAQGGQCYYEEIPDCYLESVCDKEYKQWQDNSENVAEDYDQQVNVNAQTNDDFGYYEEDGMYGYYSCDEDDICYYCEHNGDYHEECGIYYCDEDGTCYDGDYTDLWMYITEHSEEGEVDTWVHVDIVAEAIEDDDDKKDDGGLKDCEFVKSYCYGGETDWETMENLGEFCYESCDTWCQPNGGHYVLDEEWGGEECVFDNCADLVPVSCSTDWYGDEMACPEAQCDTWCVPMGGEWVAEETADWTNYSCAYDETCSTGDWVTLSYDYGSGEESYIKCDTDCQPFGGTFVSVTSDWGTQDTCLWANVCDWTCEDAKKDD